MKKITAPIPFAGSQLDQTRYVCAFFKMRNEVNRLVTALVSGVYSRFDTRFGALFCVEVKP